MFTHKQIKNMNKRWKSNYGDSCPQLIKATNIKDNAICGIHLLNPTEDEVSRAFCDAQAKSFSCIIIHTKKTFGKYCF